MTNNPTETLVARLKELLEKATPGPWGHSDDECGEIMGYIEPKEYRPIGKFWGNCDEWMGNSSLVVEAINALPTLLTALEAAQPRPNVEAVERACRILKPALFSDDAREAHSAASPMKVEWARDQFRERVREMIVALPQPDSALRDALEEFQQHVIRHVCVWDDAKNGSHHHPIWQKVAEALSALSTDQAGEL